MFVERVPAFGATCTCTLWPWPPDVRAAWALPSVLPQGGCWTWRDCCVTTGWETRRPRSSASSQHSRAGVTCLAQRVPYGLTRGCLTSPGDPAGREDSTAVGEFGPRRGSWRHIAPSLSSDALGGGRQPLCGWSERSCVAGSSSSPLGSSCHVGDTGRGLRFPTFPALSSLSPLSLFSLGWHLPSNGCT